MWNVSQLYYAAFQNKPVIGGKTASDLTAMAERWRRPKIALGVEYPGANFAMAYYNCPYEGKNYGADIAHAVSTAGLLLNLNFTNAQKEALIIHMVQTGIDTYGAMRVGMGWNGAGGQNNGRKLPLFIAAMALNDARLKDACNGMVYRNASTFQPGTKSAQNQRRFSEDQQHFYVTQWDIDTPRTGGTADRPTDPYAQKDLGMPEWASKYDDQPSAAGSNWGIYYRDVACPNNVGAAATVKIMGGELIWNHPAYFQYYSSRYVPIERNSGKIDSFQLAMWDAYAGTGSTLPPPPSAPTGLKVVK